MSNRYAPLPNPRSNRDGTQEMDAAFDDSEDEDESPEVSESRPLNPSPPSPPRSQTASHIPGTYDFENVDYDYPPPGSPPGPSAMALPNEYGNSNGVIPQFEVDSTIPPPRSRRGWFNRTATAVLPSHFVQRLGLAPQRPTGVFGAGINNDGVFANVTAKPSRPRRVQDGDDTYIVPEDARAEAPPSYASAQADAVPPYWETTVHAPFAPASVGEMIIDSLPTGSLFSFLWNMLVSISFQFVGFLLTYLLHTTHAARMGSRAGLGVTLIQYGFALRGKVDGVSGGEGQEAWVGWKVGEGQPPVPRPSFETAAEADDYYKNAGNSTTFVDNDTGLVMSDATTEWLSFFLMTVGWFILLTSLLGFWRVKRWERGILASQRENAGPTDTSAANGAFISQFERTFGLRGIAPGEFFRQGLGLGSRGSGARADEETGGGGPGEGDAETDAMMTPDRARLLAQALEHERRLQRDLRAAGLI
jgi:hypothetical protein